MSECIRVYTLEMGCYSDRFLCGVYASLDDAKAAAAPKRPFTGRRGRGQLQPEEHEWEPQEPAEVGARVTEWHNNGDWDDAATISEWELGG